MKSSGRSLTLAAIEKETFAYIERLGLPKSDTDKILHHNAQKLFGFEH